MSYGPHGLHRPKSGEDVGRHASCPDFSSLRSAGLADVPLSLSWVAVPTGAFRSRSLGVLPIHQRMADASMIDQSVNRPARSPPASGFHQGLASCWSDDEVMNIDPLSDAYAGRYRRIVSQCCIGLTSFMSNLGVFSKYCECISSADLRLQ